MRRLALLGLLLSHQAFADSCTTYIAGMFDGFPGDNRGPAAQYYVKGTRVTARSNFGFTSYFASVNYRNTMTQADKARNDSFVLTRGPGNDRQTGQFQDVFPGRPDGSIDLSTLRIYRSGRVEVVLDRWGSYTFAMNSLQCYPGSTTAANGFMMTGLFREPSGSFDQWTFLLSPYWIN
jgi:hypothetical protein